MDDRCDEGPGLETWPCQSVCRWAAAAGCRVGADPDDLLLFRCAGCGSEWVRTESWTPIDAYGVVPAAVAAERARG